MAVWTGIWRYLTLDLRQINVLRQHRLTSLLLPHVPAAFLHRVHRSAAHLLERKDLVWWHRVHMLTTLDVFRLPYSMFYDIDCMGGWQLSALLLNSLPLK